MKAVSVHHLSKKYGRVTALHDVSFEVEQGEIYGIIGPDGSGKTTLFRILATLLLPDNGNVIIGGYDAVKEYCAVRRIIGYMPGRRQPELFCDCLPYDGTGKLSPDRRHLPADRAF